MPSIHALFRTDGGSEDGMGHVMRCCTLAREMQERGWQVTFICHVAAGFDAVKELGFKVLKSPATVGEKADLEFVLNEVRARSGKTVVIIDSKRPDKPYTASISQKATVLLVDDELLRSHPCDILLNYNIWVNEGMYGSSAKLKLLGARYNLIKKDMFALARNRATQKKPRVLITFGGEDPHNHTQMVVEGLLNTLKKIDLTVVIGQAYSWPEQIRSYLAKHLSHAVLLQNTKEMAKVMQTADVAITACGTTTYELCVMQVAQLGVIIEEHQRLLAEKLADLGIMQIISDYKSFDFVFAESALAELLTNYDKSRSMTAAGEHLFSESGVGYVTEAIANYLEAKRA